MLAKCLDRIEEAIDLETTALLARDLSGLKEFNRRKSQSLLEFTRLAQTMRLESIDPFLSQRFAALREKLEANHEILGRYMRAAQEVADIISGAIVTANSDGTYAARLSHVGAGV
ncbi:flagellar protein FlgN [Microvirga sp. 2TAF3]|uniref:flagellar protein FlgN n=1 Tax=Microvirga sp. 2TAF3 TaxID=3233014 RepID=UPI003F9ABEEA